MATNSRRDRRTTRNDRGRGRRQQTQLVAPTVEELTEAAETIQNHTVPGTPAKGVVETIHRSSELPFGVGTRELKAATITSGRPGHGAMRSDDHVSLYEIELPLREVSNDAVEANECLTCGEQRAVYSYSAHHNISGHEAVECAFCGDVHYSEEWG